MKINPQEREACGWFTGKLKLKINPQEMAAI